jgi:transcriptional regulator with XRE-family HTH domain
VLRAHPNKAELARRLGVDRKTLWRYATGARPIPPHLLPRILTPAPRSPEADPDRQPALAPAPNTPHAVRRPRRPRPGGGGAEEAGPGDEAATQEGRPRGTP